MKITITYNATNDFEDAALALARRIFAQFDEAIDSLVLAPVGDEDLALHLDGDLVHSASQSGRLPLVADLRAAITARETNAAETQGSPGVRNPL